MKVMVIVKATPGSERGDFSNPGVQKMMEDMGAYNEKLAAAGILVDADGLKPSSFGKRVIVGKGKRTVVDGPFAETKELIAGYWIWEVKSIEEAVAWVKQCPAPHPGEESDIEIRPFVSAEDFGEAYTPELQEREGNVRKQLEKDLRN